MNKFRRFLIKALQSLFTRIKIGTALTAIIYPALDQIQLFRYWHNFPLNGQARRLHIMQILLYFLNPRHIVETGTYIGSSTWIFLGTSAQVYSIEINREYLGIARKRYTEFRQSSRLEFVQGDSKAILPNLLGTLDKRDSLCLYLDSHWEEEIPLREEVALLAGHQGPVLCVVDDFRNPFHPEYSYDNYSTDTAISMEIIPHYCDFLYYFSDESVLLETGSARGTLYLMNSAARRLIPDEVFLRLNLREYSSPSI